MDAKVAFIKYVELCPNMSVPTKTSVSDLRFKPAGGSHISYCDNLSKLHDFTLHRLLVEAKFPTAHALTAVQIL